MIHPSFPLAGRRRITSAQNPHYRLLKAILEGKGIRKYGWALISGKKAVKEIAGNYPQRVGGWVVHSGKRSAGVPGVDSSSGAGELVLDKKLFDAVDLWGTGGPLLIVRVDPFPMWQDRDSPLGCTLFVPFQDPGNVGTVVRSAAAFGVNRIVFLKEAAHPFHPKSSRAASGTIFQIPFFQGPSIGDLTCGNAPLFTLNCNGDDLATINFPRRFGILPGLEGPGIPQHLKALPSIRIPIESKVESLNAAAAAAIVLYSWFTKEYTGTAFRN